MNAVTLGNSHGSRANASATDQRNLYWQKVLSTGKQVGVVIISISPIHYHITGNGATFRFGEKQEIDLWDWSAQEGTLVHMVLIIYI